MGINWISGSGVFTALGGIVAAGLIVQYWQVFAIIVAVMMIHRALSGRSHARKRHAQVLHNRKVEADLTARRQS